MSNSSLVSKVRDLDKLLIEYEFNFHSFKLKQHSLEKRIEILEKEFSKIKHLPYENKTNPASTSNETNNNQKLIAVELSHKTIERELKLLKDIQLADLEIIKENIDLLQNQIFGEITKSISQNSLNQLCSVEYLQKQCFEIQERLNQLRKSKKNTADIPTNYACLKLEMRQQLKSLVEERRLFELEKYSLTQDLDKLIENAGIHITDNANNSKCDFLSSLIIDPNNVLLQESILEVEKKNDEWEKKYKNELDTFNQQSQQHEKQIKQLKQQLLAAKKNNEAKNLDLSNQLKLLNSVDEYNKVDIESNNDNVMIKPLINKEKIDFINYSNNDMSKNLLSSKNHKHETNEISKTMELIDGTNMALSSFRKSNLTVDILELEDKLNEWEFKYNKEIDAFNNQQKEQLLLNQKEETRIKLLKEQITAAKLLSGSSNEVEKMDDYNYKNSNKIIIITNNKDNANDENTKANSNIKESILNLEAKFNQLEQIYNDERIVLDNKLKILNSTLNISTSNSNLNNEDSKQLIAECKNAPINVNNIINLDELKLFDIKSSLPCPNYKTENKSEKITNSASVECILMLEAKLHEWEKKHKHEIDIFNALSKQQETQIKELKEKLNNEAVQVDNLNSDYSLLQEEANRLEVLLKQKYTSLEHELDETNKLNEYEFELLIKNNQYNKIYQDYDKEIKSLIEQISHLQKGLQLKEEEFYNLEKLIEIERVKTSSLVKQIEGLNFINIQLNMQNNEAKSRLVTLDLLTDECIQLRKNLTFLKLES